MRPAAEERGLILTNLDVADEAAARRPAPASSEVIRRLENAALQRNPGEFARMLERALGISRALAERIARDHSGEPIVVAAKALGMTAAVLQRILLFLNPAIGQSVERVYDLARLYDELTPAAAERMLTIWRQAGGRSRPRTSRCIGTTSVATPARCRRRRAIAPIAAASCSPRTSRPAGNKRRLSHHIAVEEIPSGAILDFDDPDIGIEADFTRQARFDIGFRHRRCRRRARR